MAKRYDKSEKDEVVDFIRDYNEEHGRGGQSAASKKYSINPITLKSWMDKAGVSSPGKRGKKRKSAGASSRRTYTDEPINELETLRRMHSVKEKIGRLEEEYQTLKMKL